MNLKKLMKVKDSGGLKYVKDDSLDDFFPSSSLKGFNKEGTYLYIEGSTNVDEKKFDAMLGKSMAVLIHFSSGAGLNTINTFCVKVLNNLDAIYDIVDILKSIGTWAIYYAIDKIPNIYSSQISNTSWMRKSTDDIIKIMSGEMKDTSRF